jgi:hypothetical protein
MLPIKFQFIWTSGYRGEDSLEINQSEKMNRNLVGSIFGRSSLKIANLVPIHQQTWPPQAILVSDWSSGVKHHNPIL